MFFLVFILLLPFLFILVYFNILALGFEKLGVSPLATIFILFLILIGSFINIPLTKKKLFYVEKHYFFGLFKAPKIEVQGIFINLGGAIIPILLSFYFLFLTWKSGFEIGPILIATILMVIISKFLAKTIPGKGVLLPGFIPPIFSAIFSLILAPKFAAPTAFISGVFGTLIGADLLNLRKARKYGGFISIGGAGVFDGIFLVGIVSALLAGF